MSSAGSRARADAEQASRRRMRKGTKSCLPCRSRKVRCNYPPNSRVCTACLAQGRNCVEQTYQDVRNGDLDRRVGLKQRVRELENLVQQLVQKGASDGQAAEGSTRSGNAELLSPPDSTTSRSQTNESMSQDQAAETLTDDDDASDSYDSIEDVDLVEQGSYQKAPLMALFDNNLLLRDDPQERPSSTSQARQEAFGARRQGTPTRTRGTKLVEELRALFPPWSVINATLEHGSEKITMWQDIILEHSFFGVNSVAEGLRTMSQSDQPVELCKGLAFLALVLQQTPETDKWKNPSLPKGESQLRLIQKYIDTVEAHLCSGHALIATLDGLECAVLLCRILFNEGRPRKAWLLYQRALSYARLLGFHRSASWKTSDPSIGVRRQQTWWHLFIGDRALSLLLGLPYSVMDSHVGIDPNTNVGRFDPAQNANFFSLRLAFLTGRIIDRNQNANASSSKMRAETMKIEQELQTLEDNLPPAWLALRAEDGDELAFLNKRAKEIFEALHTLAWLNECRIALHMPYLLKQVQDSSDECHEYSRRVALSCARDVIRIQLRVRSRPELTNMICQIFDFQAFMATVLLILDLLTREKDTGLPRVLKADSESLRDELLTKDAFKMLRRMADLKITKTNIPAQAIKVLETLGSLIHGQGPSEAPRSTQRIVIPYFGSITIKATSSLLEHQQAVQAHMRKVTCAPSAKLPDDLVGENASQGGCPAPELPPIAPAQMDTALFDAHTSDLTFNSFLGPQFSFEPIIPANWQDNLSNAVPQPEQAPSKWPNTFTGDSWQAAEAAAQAWDETVWQNMLTQDPTADLDMDWETLLGNM